MESIHHLKNGYSIMRGGYYTEYETYTLWQVYEPSGRLYMSFLTYEEAYEVASHLVEEAN